MVDLQVKITNAVMGDIVGKLIGIVIIDNRNYKFDGTAFGRFGGHNISVKLSPQARKWLKVRGYNADDIEIAIQEKIITGNFVLDTNAPISSSNSSQEESGLHFSYHEG